MDRSGGGKLRNIGGTSVEGVSWGCAGVLETPGGGGKGREEMGKRMVEMMWKRRRRGRVNWRLEGWHEEKKKGGIKEG